jgi:AraC-like DNA-binding protein
MTVHWELHTAPALRGSVRRIVGWSENGAPMRRLEPATTITPVILMLGPGIAVDGDRLGSFAAGPYLRPVVTEHDGIQEGIQIDLEPLAARRLMGMPMSELTESCVPIEDVLGADLTDYVADAATWPDRFKRVEQALARRLVDAPPVRAEVAWTVGRIRASGGRLRVESLARELGWSRRHLTAQVREAIGLTPKELARLVRFERVLDGLRDGRELADLAYDSGYADQPHLNRDFRAFTGLSPTRYAQCLEEPALVGVAA